MSKIREMREYLFNTKDWELKIPTEEQVKAFEILKANPYSYIGEKGKLIGLIQGYALIADSEDLDEDKSDWYLVCKLYKNGKVTSQFYASDQEEAMRIINSRMAWGALARRSNLGAWQRQLPSEISPFRSSYHHPNPDGTF